MNNIDKKYYTRILRHVVYQTMVRLSVILIKGLDKAVRFTKTFPGNNICCHMLHLQKLQHFIFRVGVN